MQAASFATRRPPLLTSSPNQPAQARRKQRHRIKHNGRPFWLRGRPRRFQFNRRKSKGMLQDARPIYPSPVPRASGLAFAPWPFPSTASLHRFRIQFAVIPRHVAGRRAVGAGEPYPLQGRGLGMGGTLRPGRPLKNNAARRLNSLENFSWSRSYVRPNSGNGPKYPGADFNEPELGAAP